GIRAANGRAKSARTSSSDQSWRMGSESLWTRLTSGCGFMRGMTMPDPAGACQRGAERRVDSCSFHEQVREQREADRQRPEHGDEDAPGGPGLREAGSGGLPGL